MTQESNNPPLKSKTIALSDGRSIVLNPMGLDLSSAYLDTSLKGVGFNEATRHFWASTEYFWGEDFSAIIAKICKAHGYTLNHENLIACLDTLQAGSIVKTEDLHLAKIGAYLPSLSFQVPDIKADGLLLQSFYSEIEQLAQARSLAMGQKSGAGDEKSGIKKLQEQIDYLTLKNSNLQRQIQEVSAVGIVQSSSTDSEHSAELLIGKILDIDTNTRQIKVRAAGKSLTLQFEELSYLPAIGQSCTIYLDANVRPHKLIVFRTESSLPVLTFKKITILAERNGLIKIKTQDGEIWQIIQKPHEPAFKRGSVAVAQFQGNTILRVIDLANYKNNDELMNMAYIQFLALDDKDDDFIETDLEIHEELTVQMDIKRTVNS